MHWNTRSSGNRLFDRITRLVPTLQEFRRRLFVPSRTVLYKPGESMPYLYFPAGGVLSSLVREHEGGSAEASSIGMEGVAPIFTLLGFHKCPMLLVQQVAGDLIRVPAAAVARAMRERERVHVLMLCYFAYKHRASNQATVCNALHSALARTARVLLTIADRTQSDQFHLTQTMLAQMLGTPRQTINVSMREMARRQLVRVSRGQVRLLNRAAIEKVSCRCYPLMNGLNWD